MTKPIAGVDEQAVELLREVNLLMNQAAGIKEVCRKCGFTATLIDGHECKIGAGVEFDENKSQGSMPRLYEHIDRVDLWIMAQKVQFDQLRAEIERLRAENEASSLHHEDDLIVAGEIEAQLQSENARYKAALADFIEAFEGQYGGDFWNSPLGIKHRALKENE